MGLLQIDGTSVAVLLNFLILLWILNRYLYKPVLKMLEDRRVRVEGTVASAERKEQEADILKSQYEKKLSDARTEAQQIIDEALKTSERIRTELTAEGRAEATTIREKALIDIENMKQAASKELRGDVVDLAIAAAEKIIEKSLDEAVNRKYVSQVIERIRSS